MGELRSRVGVAARALEFTILTAARTGEVIGAKWPEFDLVKGVWTVPADRMKAGREHQLPLSKPVLDLLADLPREGQFVFIGARAGKPLSNMAMLELLRGMRDGLTVHGFRSTFRDWAGETTAYPREVIEHALAHQLKDKAEAAYARGTLFAKRRRLMEDWSGYCASARRAGHLVPIRGDANA
jgi:integrase